MLVRWQDLSFAAAHQPRNLVSGDQMDVSTAPEHDLTERSRLLHEHMAKSDQFKQGQKSGYHLTAGVLAGE